MTSFLQDVIADLQKKDVDFSQLIFVLPSKRAGLFLTHSLSKALKKTIFVPEIISIEEFVENLSELKYATNTELLFDFYGVYSNVIPKEQLEPFDKFSKWAQILLQDFNEIDRYLIEPENIFEYLKAIKELNHWSLSENQTDATKNYISFWSYIQTFYFKFKDCLTERKKGYQGLVYREAVEGVEHYVANNPNKRHVFVGFNALNKAEEIIIQELLQQELAYIYWDIDETFIKNPIHDAGLFMRNHKATWSYFEKHPFNWTNTHYQSQKNIEVVGIPKNIGQVKYIGELLDKLHTKQTGLENTAIVLGDETLLLPLLNSIPAEIDAINITMGLPLKSIPLATLFEELFLIHKNDRKNEFYYKDVVSILSHQFVKPLFQTETVNYSDEIINHILKNNIVYVSLHKLEELCGVKKHIISFLFESWDNLPEKAIKQCSELIIAIKNNLSIQKDRNLLELEYLYRFNEIFNELNQLNLAHHHINNIQVLLSLYKELLKNETLDFKGEPLQGLQIMGMLESRVLDFETVIISSVNEGILPAGKSNNSFIPYDVKIENGLPTYKEKDAVYTYHFYRLLQRAKNVYILYNTEPDVLNGGEKSRFITQLEIEKLHDINHYMVAPIVPPISPSLKVVKKTDDVLQKIKSVAEKGFSPSSLTNYIRNPIDFYYEKILGIKRYEEIEETVADNTLGTIIHETLEEFYKPVVGQILTEKHIIEMKSFIDTTVEKFFKAHYKEGTINKGKNLIIFEIAKRYVNNFLNKELESIQAGNSIKILALEQEVKTEIRIAAIDFPITIKGNVDRIDEFNGTKRIIDYKTGKVEQHKVEVVDWEAILTDYDKYSKSFQVLTYAYILNAMEAFSSPIEAGIISFKNLQGDYFLKFAKKDKSGRGAQKEFAISSEILTAFETQLVVLISEICNPEIDFVEKLLD
ncbi:PD-(D/E)XK nuclease family protein [Subsaxibacter sp. CAU 1640]|uniref:PD-(D/E)XK nuclease family protein n=1 Tax=Subsaxibacter sp. CAU 1640 TaxID=2933271 RepID=UPI002002BD2D|nr:PD-(D/E)XK nuclease family protein [Subsaxibacter sp. CAU 1640]MCK7589406.1 PD-(D/E)XK nuclease family protein [Subsaxibacter sp. CAU 1640]